MVILRSSCMFKKLKSLGFISLTLLVTLILTLLLSFKNVYSAEVTIEYDPPDIGQDLVAGYKVHWGHTINNYPSEVDCFDQLSCHVSIPNPESGKSYHFALTSYDDSGNESHYSEELVAYTIEASTTTGGTISPSNPVLLVKKGENVIFTIIPNAGYYIEDVVVDGTSVGAVATYIFNNVQSNHTITASLTDTITPHTITASASSGGSIFPSGSVTVNHGEDQIFTITPDTDFHIADVLVDGVSVGAVSSYTFTNVAKDHSINVIFSNIDPSDDLVASYNFNEGSGTTANDSSGNSHNGTLHNGATWTSGKQGGGISFDGINDYVDIGKFDVMGSELTIAAWFKADSFNHLSSFHDARIVSKATGTADQDHYWMLSTIKNGNTTKLRFRLKTNGTTSTLIADSGNLITNEWIHAAAVYDGSSMKLYKDGVLVGSMSKTGAIDTNSSTPVWIGTNPDGYGTWKGVIDDVLLFNRALTEEEIIALYFDDSPSSYIITATSGNGGTISPSGAVVVEHDKSQTFSITPYTGYHIQDVKVDGNSVGAVTTYSFTNVTTDHTIAATFAKDTYTITASASSGGSIFPSGSVTVNHGEDQILTITPDTDFHIADVLVDGVSVGAVSTYTFTNVTKDHSINVFFSNIDPSDDLVASYNFNEGSGTAANDSSGNGHNGTLHNGAAWTSGKQGDGIDFDGIDDYVDIGKFDVIGSELTIAAWFKADSFNHLSSFHDARILSKATGIATAGTAEQDHYWMLSTIKNSNTTKLRFRLKTNGTTSTLIADSGNLVTNEWIHAAAVYDGSSMKLYKDGVLVGSMSKTGAIDTNSSTSVWIGANPDGYGTWKGVIDDVLIFNRALTEEEIIALYFDDSPSSYIITATSGNGGTISPSGAVVVEHNKSQTFSITPYSGYHIQDVKVDGTSAGAVTKYTFTNVIVNHTIEALFKQDIFEDADGDGISDDDEISIYGTDPANADTDGDGIDDGKELELWGDSWNADTDGDGLINLLDDDSDDDGFLDGVEFASGSDPEDSLSTPHLEDVIEIGEVNVDHNWQKITFTKTFFAPVMVAKMTSYNDNDPAVVRIRNVDSTGFEIRIQEWQYLDDIHSEESVSYMVLERGMYTLNDGTMVEANKLETDNTNSFKVFYFNKTFNTQPVMITAITSFNEEDTVTGRLEEIQASSFRSYMEEQESNSQIHAPETISYIAWEPSAGTIGNLIFEVQKTDDILGDAFRKIQFTETLTDVPVLLTDMQTTDGGDTANLRCQNLNMQGVDMKIHEEQSNDNEIDHTSEIGGYIAISN
jgi:hypothetical protein